MPAYQCAVCGEEYESLSVRSAAEAARSCCDDEEAIGAAMQGP